MFRNVWIVLLLPALIVAGCHPEPEAPPESDQTSWPALTGIPTRAQPRLPTIPLYVGPHELEVEMALRRIEIQTGMMFRDNLGRNEGMLFVFPFPRQQSFWMKNVDVPLSVAYIDPDGIILEIYDMTPHEEAAIISQSHDVQFVLEVNQNWFERNDIRPGTAVQTGRGTLLETFFGDPALRRLINQ